jgi:antitoxin component YwqK of YwqJK toxin-antitoxin module
MKKLIFIAALLFVTLLVSCYAPSQTKPTQTSSSETDLPYTNEAKSDAPADVLNWQYDPNPYDNFKIYGGRCGSDTAYVCIEDGVSRLIIESYDNDRIKTTYTVLNLDLAPIEGGDDNAYTLCADEYVVTSDSTVISEGKNFHAEITLDNKNGICTVYSISAEDNGEGEVSLKHRYNYSGDPIRSNFTSGSKVVSVQYHTSTHNVTEKTTTTFDSDRNRTHYLVQGWYKEGYPYYIKEYADGISATSTIYYHKNGNVMSETYYVKGRTAIQSAKNYDEDGVLASETYVEGNRRYDVSYFEDGKTVRRIQVEVIDEKTYHTLYLESSKRWYDPDTLANETVGNEYGYLKCIDYYSDGALKKVTTYREGKKYLSHTQYKIVNVVESEITYYQNGNPETEFRYGDKYKVIREYRYNENGTPKYLRDTSEDVDIIVQYHGDSGVKSSEYIFYIKLDRDTETEWYPNGVLRSVEEWVNGYRNSKLYYEDGSIWAETTESYARRETINYYQSGVIQSVYIHTPRVRTLTEYDENGKKIRFTHTDCEPDGTILNKYVEEYE